MKNFIKTKPIISAFICSSVLFVLFAPFIVERVLFRIGRTFALTCSFSPDQILSYIGAVLSFTATVALGFIVYRQTSKSNKQNMKLAANSLSHSTHTYLVVDSVKVLEIYDNSRKEAHPDNEIKSFKLIENISLSTPELNYETVKFSYGYPYDDFVDGCKKTSVEEFVVEIDVATGKTKKSCSNINLPLFSIHPPFDGKPYYTHCTPLQLVFYAKPSREFFVSKMKLHKLGLGLICETPFTALGAFESHLQNGLDINVSSLTLEDAGDCNHQFGINLYLIHDNLGLIAANSISGLNLHIKATYINPFDVETTCEQVIWFKGDKLATKELERPVAVINIELPVNTSKDEN